MKTILIVMLLINSYIFTNAQNNLLPNPSFEEYDSCNFTSFDPFVATNWRRSPYAAGTADYFNTCKNPGEGGVPTNLFGYQEPKDGNAYVGGGYAFDPASIFDGGECIETTLLDTLEIGKKYLVKFYVCKSETNWSGNTETACNKIGAKLSTISYSNPLSNSGQSIFNNISQVYTNDIITDTSKWTKIEGSFIADSSYTYFSIGMFFSNDQVTAISLDPFFGIVAYYFFDDASLVLDTTYNGEEENKINNEIILYPNPGTNNFNIQKGEGYQLTVYDVIGKQLFTQQLKNYNEQIDMSNYNKGLYFIKLNKEGKETYIEKFIKQ